MKIFLLEDDENLAFGIKTYMENQGYSVLTAASLQEAREKFSYDFDIYILDINLPDGSGFDFLDIFSIEESPLLFLTVNDSEEDIIRGLNLGDGYITKPFKLAILQAKIESVLRRVDNRDDNLNYRGLVLNTSNYACLIDARDIGLTRKEYELLELLLRNKGSTLTRSKILEIVWDQEDSFVDDNTLSVTVKRLRKKLGPYSNVIETVRGIGYRFVRD